MKRKTLKVWLGEAVRSCPPQLKKYLQDEGQFDDGMPANVYLITLYKIGNASPQAAGKSLVRWWTEFKSEMNRQQMKAL